MSKLFTVAGTSNLEGVVKFRVANGSAAARTKVLERSGHKDIKLVDLAKPMSKEDAIAFVKSQGSAFAAETATAAKPAKAPKAAKPAKLAVVPKAAKPAKAPAAPVEVAAKPSANSIDEIAKIKAKNLETMRRVSNKLAALRNYN